MEPQLQEFRKVYDYVVAPGWWSILLQAVDVLLVSFIVYRILLLVRGRYRILYGILGFAVLLPITQITKLTTLNWLLEKVVILAPIALAIIFLPELRQAVEGVGKFGGLADRLTGKDEIMMEAQTIEEIVAAAAEMSGSRTGALIAIERAGPLSDIASNGVPLGARVTAALLCSIFYEGGPLHDGAVVIRDNTVLAAGCRLPLSESARLDSSMHMRHRAALGLVEDRDAIVVVVSEERGYISVAQDGDVRRMANPGELRDMLRKKTRETPQPRDHTKRRIFSRARQPR